MRWLKTMTAIAFATLCASGCTTDPLAPNVQDPNGPRVNTVNISYCVDVSTIGNSVVCYPTATLAVGNSAQLQAKATNGDEDLTSQCAWVWRTNSRSVSIRVNQPSQSAVVTKNPFNISGAQITVTATCNGVSGSYNIL